MKLVQVVPVAGERRGKRTGKKPAGKEPARKEPTRTPSLKRLLKETERRLRGGPTAFRRRGEGRWVHVKHPGWINWDLARGGILVAEVQSKKADEEWKLLQAFIGYLDRHLGDDIDTITINYR